MSDLPLNVDAIVKAIADRVRRALESGGGIELQMPAPTPVPIDGYYCSGYQSLPTITTLIITDYTAPAVSYDELVESWLERNQRRLEEFRPEDRPAYRVGHQMAKAVMEDRE